MAIFTNLGQSLSQKGGLFLIFEPILRAGFLDKMLGSSQKKSTFVFGFLAVFTKKTPCKNLMLNYTNSWKKVRTFWHISHPDLTHT